MQFQPDGSIGLVSCRGKILFQPPDCGISSEAGSETGRYKAARDMLQQSPQAGNLGQPIDSGDCGNVWMKRAV
jgi:hypothetical protein